MSLFTSHGNIRFAGDWKIGSDEYSLFTAVKPVLDAGPAKLKAGAAETDWLSGPVTFIAGSGCSLTQNAADHTITISATGTGAALPEYSLALSGGSLTLRKDGADFSSVALPVYSAGTGLALSGGQFSVDQEAVAFKTDLAGYLTVAAANGNYEPKNANIQTHISNTAGNPHGVSYTNLLGTFPGLTPASTLNAAKLNGALPALDGSALTGVRTGAALTLQVGGTAKGIFNGSSAFTFNVTAGDLGALTALPVTDGVHSAQAGSLVLGDGLEAVPGEGGSVTIRRKRRDAISFTGAGLTSNKLTVADAQVGDFTILDADGVMVLPVMRQLDGEAVSVDFTDWTVTGTWKVVFR